MTSSWVLFALGSAVFAGLTAIWGKVGVESIPSNIATLLRTAVILVFIASVVFVRQEWRNAGPLSTRSLVFILLSGLATGLSWMCYYRALQLGPASLVAPIDKLSLMIAVVFSVLFLGEKLNLYQWLGAGLMVSGALLLALKQG